MSKKNNSDLTNEEFKDLVDEKPYNKKNNKERMVIFGVLFALLIISLIVFIIIIFTGQKYNIEINYSIPQSFIQENFDKAFVSLSGDKNYNLSYTLEQEIKLMNIDRGNYQIQVSLQNQDGKKYYYKTKDLFLNEDTEMLFELSRNSIIYDPREEWINNDLLITLPEGYDLYLVYEYKNNNYELVRQSDENRIWFRNAKGRKMDFIFSVIKDDLLFDYSEPFIYQALSQPDPPRILSPEKEAIFPGNTVVFVWQGSHPDGVELSYDLKLFENGNERIIAENITEVLYEYDNLKADKKYTFELIAKDSANQKRSSTVVFYTGKGFIDDGTEKYESSYLFREGGQRGLLILEITEKSEPKEIDNINLNSNVTQVIRENNNLYILKENQGISIADIYDGKNIDIIRNININNSKEISIVEDHLFVRTTDDLISIYSLKDSRINPSFIGFAEQNQFAVRNPKLVTQQDKTEKNEEEISKTDNNESENIIVSQKNYEFVIISSEYPMRTRDGNNINITNFTLILATEEAKTRAQNRYSMLFETVRFIINMRRVEDFQTNKNIEDIKDTLKTAINEVLGYDSQRGVKEIILNVK